MSAPKYPPWAKARRMAACMLLLALAIPGLASTRVEFHVSFDASADVLTDAERAKIEEHVRRAGERWAEAIGIPTPRYIEIVISIDDIPTANGGSTTSAFIGTIDGRDTYEQGVARELRLNEDPNMGEPDGHITIGLDYLRNELWFDPDPVLRTAPVPSNRTDAMSTMLHELGHIIAYNGWADLITGTPNTDYWSIFDSWFVSGASPVFAGPAATAAWGAPPELTIGNIFHWANAAQQVEGAQSRCVAEPVFWRWGAPVPSVCSVPPSADAPHGANGTDGSPGLVNQLMNGVVFYRGTRYDISSLDIGVLQDVGLIEDSIFADGFE